MVLWLAVLVLHYSCPGVLASVSPRTSCCGSLGLTDPFWKGT